MADKNITKYFIYKEIPIKPGIPTFDRIQQVHTKLNANAASVLTTLGGGQHVHLFLTLTNDESQTFTRAVADHPNNPGEIPPGPSNTFKTAHERDQHIVEHQCVMKADKTYKATDIVLQHLLTNAFEETFLLSVKNRYTGYTYLLTRDVLQQLYTLYGRVSPAKLAAVDEQMKRKLEPSLTIKHLVKQVESAVHIVGALSTLYMVSQILSMAYNLLHQTEVYNEACRE
jgi:hypothetical protein